MLMRRMSLKKMKNYEEEVDEEEEEEEPTNVPVGRKGKVGK